MRAPAYTSTAARPAQFVYHLLSEDDSPLYVGRSSDVARRIKQHHYHATRTGHPLHDFAAAWLFDVRSVSMVGPLSWPRAVEFEREQIERLQPRGNVKLTKRDRWLLRNRNTVPA